MFKHVKEAIKLEKYACWTRLIFKYVKGAVKLEKYACWIILLFKYERKAAKLEKYAFQALDFWKMTPAQKRAPQRFVCIKIKTFGPEWGDPL